MKGRAGGVIDLKNFVDCVEAPLSDQKKANNVFFLVAEERGFFDQVLEHTMMYYNKSIIQRAGTTSQPRH